VPVLDASRASLVKAGALPALAVCLRAQQEVREGRDASAVEALAVQVLAAVSDPETELEAMVAAGLVEPLLHLSRYLAPSRARKLAVQTLGDIAESYFTRYAIAELVRAQPQYAMEAMDAVLLVDGAAYDAAERECWRELTRNCELRTDLYKPGKPWYDPHSGEFPFVKELEQRWQEIREEALHLREELMVAWPEKYLYTTGWDVLGFFAFENKLEGPCATCPKTVAMLESIPGLQTAVFSRLKPHSHIKPHVGYYSYSDKILRVHLGLIVPDGCTLNVNGQRRQWKEGEVLIFDDTFRHEVWNPSDTQERIILMFDINYTFDEETRNPDFMSITKRQREAMADGADVPALVTKDLIQQLQAFGVTTPHNFQQRPDTYH